MNEIFENIFNAAKKPVDYSRMNEKVSIKKSQIVNKEVNREFDGNVKSVVQDILDIPTLVDYPSMTVYDLLDERERKDAALHIFSSDWPFAVEALKGLKIVVEGYCPDCGERLEEMYQQTEAETHDYPGAGFNYLECPRCEWNDYNEKKPFA